MRTPTEDACRRVQGRLEELLDGALPPLEAARDEGHLEVCAACGAERALLEGVCGLVAEAGRPAADELERARAGLSGALAAAAAARARPGRRALRLTRGRGVQAALTAAAGLLALLAIELARPSEDGFGKAVEEVGRAYQEVGWRPGGLSFDLSAVLGGD